jgi:Flp pilus assembly protein TadB
MKPAVTAAVGLCGLILLVAGLVCGSVDPAEAVAANARQNHVANILFLLGIGMMLLALGSWYDAIRSRRKAAAPPGQAPQLEGRALARTSHEGGSKLQSQQLREVRAHLTEAERQSLARGMRRFAIWMLFLAGIGSSTAALHGTLAIILVAAWAVLFLGSFLLGMSWLSKFYCTTVWAKQHDYSEKTFRLFAWPLGK